MIGCKVEMFHKNTVEKLKQLIVEELQYSIIVYIKMK